MTKTILVFTVVIIFAGIAVWLFVNKSKNANAPAEISPSPIPSVSVEAVPTASPVAGKIIELEGGLKIQDLTVGSGKEAVNGHMIAVNYIGTLADGKKFDSSYDRGTPFQFTLGVGQVIQGWEKGVAGMKVGGKRKLIIPPALGYGDRNIGNGLIPPNSTLIFEVELLMVEQ